MKQIDKKENKIEQYYIKSDLIFEYLNNTFKTRNIIKEELINNTVYKLIFNYECIGIMISNEMIINANIDILYNYSFDLVFEELIKITKMKYLRNEVMNNE